MIKIILIYLLAGIILIEKEDIVFLKSDILKGSEYKKLISILIWPLFLIKNLNKLNMKKILITTSILLSIYIILFGTKTIIDLNNQEKITYLQYNSLIKQRGIVYDKMSKILSNKMQIAKINDTSYYKNLIAITVNRKDNEQLFMKWVTENNPNINYNEVSILYKDLCLSVETDRGSLEQIETVLREKELEYKQFVAIFPNSILLFNKSDLDYRPIMSDYSNYTNQTSVDNKTKLD